MPRKKSTTLPARTSTEELPVQAVMDFFAAGIHITEAPKDIVLKKANAAIKVASTLGLFERKILDAAVFVAKPKLLENSLHSVDLSYFKWLIAYNSENHQYIKRAITKIQQTVIQINIIDEQDPSKDFWHSTPFLYDVSITGGRIFFRIPESLRKPLQDPKSYTHLSLRIKNRFTSEYAYILYDRCRADQYRGATDWWTIPEFREIMNVVNMYDAFQDLSKRVIKTAIEQINEYSDIHITPDYQTRGRAKTAIRFLIDENPLIHEEHVRERLPQEVFQTLKTEFGFSNSQIDAVAEYDLDHLDEAIRFSRHRMKTSKNKIKRPDLYLLKVLKEEITFNSGELADLEHQTPALPGLQEPFSGPVEPQGKVSATIESFEALPIADQHALLATFEKTLPPHLIGFFESNGVHHVAVKSIFVEWFRSR